MFFFLFFHLTMNIYISSLSFDVTDKDLRDLFAEYGEVTSAKVITDRDTGKSRGFGFVEMSNDAEAQKAIEELNQAEFDGRVINVNEARPKTDRPRSNFGDRERSGSFGNRGGGGGGGYQDKRGGGGYNSDNRGGGKRW